jgi:hypothetical protein
MKTSPPPTTNIYLNSRYKPKKVWPPNFSKLSEKEQFRFERRYKRRVKLATARPRWDKYVKLAQLGSVTCKSPIFVKVVGQRASVADSLGSLTVVLVYSVLFMDWNTDTQPFEGVCDFYRSVKKNEWELTWAM